MLYQLSYASSIHRKLLRSSEERAGTRPLRTYYGTEIKVSIPTTMEQTGKAVENERARRNWNNRLHDRF
jgi:hypothetical protein